MGTENKNGDPPGELPPLPALPTGQSTSATDADALLKGASASRKEVVVATAATLDDLSKMESAIMARLEMLLLKYSSGGGGGQPPPVNLVPPLPVDQAALANPVGVAPPPAGFVAATAVTMHVGSEQLARQKKQDWELEQPPMRVLQLVHHPTVVYLVALLPLLSQELHCQQMVEQDLPYML